MYQTEATGAQHVPMKMPQQGCCASRKPNSPYAPRAASQQTQGDTKAPGMLPPRPMKCTTDLSPFLHLQSDQTMRFPEHTEGIHIGWKYKGLCRGTGRPRWTHRACPGEQPGGSWSRTYPAAGPVLAAHSALTAQDTQISPETSQQPSRGHGTTSCCATRGHGDPSPQLQVGELLRSGCTCSWLAEAKLSWHGRTQQLPRAQPCPCPAAAPAGGTGLHGPQPHAPPVLPLRSRAGGSPRPCPAPCTTHSCLQKQEGEERGEAGNTKAALPP